jgi:DNA ligase-1
VAKQGRKSADKATPKAKKSTPATKPKAAKSAKPDNAAALATAEVEETGANSEEEPPKKRYKSPQKSALEKTEEVEETGANSEEEPPKKRYKTQKKSALEKTEEVEETGANSEEEPPKKRYKSPQKSALEKTEEVEETGANSEEEPPKKRYKTQKKSALEKTEEVEETGANSEEEPPKKRYKTQKKSALEKTEEVQETGANSEEEPPKKRYKSQKKSALEKTEASATEPPTKMLNDTRKSEVTAEIQAGSDEDKTVLHKEKQKPEKEPPGKVSTKKTKPTNVSVKTIDISQKAASLEGVESGGEPLKKRGRKQQAEPEDAESDKELPKRSRKPRVLKKGMAESAAEQPTSRAKSPRRLKKTVEPSPEPEAKTGTKAGNTSKDKKESKSTSSKDFFKKASSKDKAKVKDVRSKADTDPEAGETSEAASGEESIESDEDEIKKPNISMKARKAVQTKLTSKGKDVHPYPDWKAGDPVPYAALCKSFELIESTTKRLEKLSHTSLFLQQVLRLTPDELLHVVHLMINKIAADYEGVELGIGESLLMKAICESCGRSMVTLKEQQRQVGDLGEVAMKSRNTQSTLFAPKPLTVRGVHASLKDIATIKGEGGQGRKVTKIMNMLSAAQGLQAKYLIRGLEGKLRLGLAERTLIVGLSQAAIVHEAEKEGKKPPSLEAITAAESILKSVYSELPNYEVIIPEILKGGIMNLKDACKLQPGIPLKPMLAKPTKAISEVLDRFENKRFTCEYKYDGERVQIHYVAPNSSQSYPTIDKEKGTAKIFSRNSEELSPKYPDILGALKNWVKEGVESFVLDCEAVAWDRDEKRVLPFQQLMTRKRKDVTVEDVKVKVCVFGFDFLFLNGRVRYKTLPLSIYLPN